VLSGALRSQVDNGEAKGYHAGESWMKRPGAHRRIGENASTTEPVKLFAIFVLDIKAADTELTILDHR
jgi:quercetin dioxygenase-like cupin family protein